MKTSALSALFLFASSPAMAAAFALNTQSAEALGAGTAGAQAAHATPGNIYFNPAAIVGVDGVEGSLSVIGVLNNSNYNSFEGALFGTVPVSGAQSGETPLDDGVFPTGAIAAKLSERFYVGLALYAPYGFGSAYARDSAVRYHGTDSDLVSASITPVIGFAINENWSIAAGPRFQYADVGLEGAVDAGGVAFLQSVPGAVPGTDDVFFDLQGDSFDVGYIVGLQGEVTEGVRVGASFTSKIEHGLSGPADFDVSESAAGQALQAVGLFLDTDFTADFATPAVAQFGAQIDLTPRITLLASANLTLWNSFEEVAAVFANPVQPADVLSQNWNDAWSGSLGAEIELSPTARFRFGAMYEDAPVEEAFTSPRIPDGDRIWGSVGFSKVLSERMELHLAASYLVADDIPVSQPAARPENALRGSLDGVIENEAFVFGLGIDYRF